MSRPNQEPIGVDALEALAVVVPTLARRKPSDSARTSFLLPRISLEAMEELVTETGSAKGAFAAAASLIGVEGGSEAFLQSVIQGLRTTAARRGGQPVRRSYVLDRETLDRLNRTAAAWGVKRDDLVGSLLWLRSELLKREASRRLALQKEALASAESVFSAVLQGDEDIRRLSPDDPYDPVTVAFGYIISYAEAFTYALRAAVADGHVIDDPDELGIDWLTHASERASAAAASEPEGN